MKRVDMRTKLGTKGFYEKNYKSTFFYICCCFFFKVKRRGNQHKLIKLPYQYSLILFSIVIIVDVR